MKIIYVLKRITVGSFFLAGVIFSVLEAFHPARPVHSEFGTAATVCFVAGVVGLIYLVVFSDD